MTEPSRFNNLGYSHIEPQIWIDHIQGGELINTYCDQWRDFKTHMRSLVPVPWYWRGRGERCVVLQEDGLVTSHVHPEWTLIYYAHFGKEDHGSVIVEGVEWRVERDSAILVPPNADHSVPPSPHELRISIAFRVFAHNEWISTASTRGEESA